MKGFLKRDLALLLPKLRFLAGFLVLVLGIGLAGNVMAGAASLMGVYAFVYMIASVTSLFNWDNSCHWNAYAAAVPTGRRAMVDARYLLTLLLALGASVLTFLFAVLTRRDFQFGIELVCAFAGVTLFYAAVIIPVCYRFGGDKTQAVMLVLVAILAGAMAFAGTLMDTTLAGEGGSIGSLLRHLVPLPLVSLPAFAVSWLISRRIMAKKEF